MRKRNFAHPGAGILVEYLRGNARFPEHIFEQLRLDQIGSGKKSFHS